MDQAQETSSNPQASKSSAPRKNIFSNKVLLTIGGFIMLFIFALLLVLFLTREKTESPKITDTEQLNLSKDSADFIESQRNSDGSYLYIAHPEENCITENGAEVCPFGNNKISTRVNAWTAFANYSYFKISGDKVYQERMERDNQTLINWCQTRLDECLWVLAQPLIIYEDSQDKNLLSFFDQTLPKLLDYKASTGNSMILAIEARELALAYKINGNPQYLTEAKRRTAQAREQIAKEQSIFRTNAERLTYDECWAIMADIEIAGIENNNQALSNAVYFLDKTNFTKNFDRFDNPISVQPCIESYALLYKYTQAPEYLTKAKDLFKLFQMNFVDSKDNKYAYGKSGTTYYNKFIVENTGKKLVNLTDTSYTNYLLYLINP